MRLSAPARLAPGVNRGVRLPVSAVTTPPMTPRVSAVIPHSSLRSQA
jgi:hypothetical protein